MGWRYARRAVGHRALERYFCRRRHGNQYEYFLAGRGDLVVCVRSPWLDGDFRGAWPVYPNRCCDLDRPTACLPAFRVVAAIHQTILSKWHISHYAEG